MAASKPSGAAYRQAASNIEAVVEAGKQGLSAGLAVVGTETVNVVRTLLTGPSPSAPGNPPGLVYGGARLSYTSSTGHVGEERWVDIASDASTRRPVTGEQVDYPKYLEFGTALMKARPHLRPAMAVVTPSIAPIVMTHCVAAQKARAAALRATMV